MTSIHEIKQFSKGVHTMLNPEIIPEEALQDSQNWYSINGVMKLINGKTAIGSVGTLGAIYGEIFGYKVDGTTVHWRKNSTAIQYFDGTTWQNTVTGLTADSDYTFANYSSLAGTFTYAFGVDGIYKFHNANPGSYCSMYDSAKNFKGYALIDRGRAILWNRERDKTGLYGSWIDNQAGVSGSTGVYTTVSGEALADVATGTLAFKAGGATRNCFGVTITDTSSGEVFTDNYDGTLTGSISGTGTINYITGAFTITGQSGAGTADYQWENSNLRGITDFSKSATRLAGEGFQFPQDEGGDAIITVKIGQDGAYYSLKGTSCYRLELDATDTNATNEVYRKEIAVQSLRGAVSTGGGIVFMNMANPENPEMTILVKNITDNVEPKILFRHFDFSRYTFDDCTMDTYDRYVLVACKSSGAVNNDTILLCDIQNKTVDITNYYARTFARDAGLLYCGSSLTQTVYNLFSGYDDEGDSISNYFITRDELFGSERLKKYRKLRLKGNISPDQSYEVYINYDDSGFQLVGTIVGSASYVDYTSSQSIGGYEIGNSQIGGDDVTNIYPYFAEIKLKKVPKFRKRSLKFIAKEIGYVDINYIQDYDLQTFEQRIPTRFRQKQNVSLDGTETNQ